MRPDALLAHARIGLDREVARRLGDLLHVVHQHRAQAPVAHVGHGGEVLDAQVIAPSEVAQDAVAAHGHRLRLAHLVDRDELVVQRAQVVVDARGEHFRVSDLLAQGAHDVEDGVGLLGRHLLDEEARLGRLGRGFGGRRLAALLLGGETAVVDAQVVVRREVEQKAVHVLVGRLEPLVDRDAIDAVDHGGRDVGAVFEPSVLVEGRQDA